MDLTQIPPLCFKRTFLRRVHRLLVTLIYLNCITAFKASVKDLQHPFPLCCLHIFLPIRATKRTKTENKKNFKS